LTNNAIWLGSVPDTENATLYVPELTSTIWSVSVVVL
jgi:hypothetical protein